MQDDEAATVASLESYKQAFGDLIRQHRGRVVDSPGDNLLAEFASVVDAVQCAVAVQKEFHAHNAELPENRRMRFRIGVNLGDVIEEGERIYGDRVNIAARLESLADPGGVCISKTAFDQIEIFFSDGITDEIITALSKLSQIFVIAATRRSPTRASRPPPAISAKRWGSDTFWRQASGGMAIGCGYPCNLWTH